MGRHKIYTDEEYKIKRALDKSKWSKLNTRCITVRYNLVYDKLILAKLDSVPNKADYIRTLILDDINKKN